MNTYTIRDEQDTAKVAAALAPAIRGGSVIGLSGDLGAGKTTLVRYLVASAGGDTRAVSSPTYTLQHEYKLSNGLTIEHWDLYRLSTLPLELEERTPQTVARLVEWPERCPEVLSLLTCHIRLSRTSDEDGSGARLLEVSGRDAQEVVTFLRGTVDEA